MNDVKSMTIGEALASGNIQTNHGFGNTPYPVVEESEVTTLNTKELEQALEKAQKVLEFSEFHSQEKLDALTEALNSVL